jgi:hypothetical protein
MTAIGNNACKLRYTSISLLILSQSQATSRLQAESGSREDLGSSTWLHKGEVLNQGRWGAHLSFVVLWLLGSVEVPILRVVSYYFFLFWLFYFFMDRHFHYIPEILASFFWCVPALFTHPIAYFYPVYLTLLLVDRASRDDARCADKYNKSWAAYCSKVPYKIVPGVY